MDGFIDALSPEAEKRITAYNKQVIELIRNIGKASTSQIGGKTPSQTDSAIKDLNAQLLKQDEIIKKLQGDYLKLAEAKKANNSLSVQQRVDNSILLQQAKQQATVVSQVADAYKKLSTQEAIAARNLQNLISSGRQANQTQRQFNAEVAKAQKEWQGYRNRILAADEAVGRWGRSSKRTIQGANELAGALGFTLGIAGTVALGKSIFDTTAKLQSLNLALQQVVGSEEEAARVQTFLSQTAEDYGVNIQTLTQSYIGFYAGAKNAIESGKISAIQIQEIFQSVAKASGALGLSQDQQEGAFLAIQQMISKGNIQAEELRGQLSERLPGAFGILAKSMGVTEIELNKMLKDGKVLAAEVLPEFAKQLEKAYGIENLQRVETLNASTTRLANSWTEFIEALNSGNGVFSSGLVNLIDKLAEAVKGASYLLDAEKSREETLAEIRQKGYDNTVQYYRKTKEADDEYIARKRIQALEEIKTMQEQIRVNTEANAEILRLSKTRYVQNGAEDINTNRNAILALNNQIKYYYGVIAAGDAVLAERNKKIEKNTKLTKDQLKAIEDAAKQAYENRKRELELDLQVIDRTLNDEEVYYNTRLRALELHWKKRQELLLLAYNEEVRLSKGNYGKQKEALLKFHSEALKEIESYNKEREQLESLALQPKEVVKKGDSAQEQLNKNAKQNIENLEKQTEAGKEHEKGLEAQEQAMRDYAKTFEDSFGASAGMQTTFDILNNNILGFGANAKVTALAISESFQEMFNFINQLSQENFDAQRERLAQETQIALAFAGESDTARAEIERQAEERRKEIARREFRAKKEQAKFNIIIDTAQAVVAALPNIPLSILIGILGLAQLAKVNSQQVPEFYKGTENAPNGWAWTQERGQELILDKNNKVKSYGNNKGAQLTKLDAGDKVKTAEETKRILSSSLIFDNQLNNIMANNGISSPIVVQNNGGGITDAQMNRLASIVESIPQPIIGIDKNGWNTSVRNGHTTKEILNNQVSFGRK